MSTHPLESPGVEKGPYPDALWFRLENLGNLNSDLIASNLPGVNPVVLPNFTTLSPISTLTNSSTVELIGMNSVDIFSSYNRASEISGQHWVIAHRVDALMPETSVQCATGSCDAETRRSEDMTRS